MLLRQLLRAVSAGAQRRPRAEVIERAASVPGVRIDRSGEPGIVFDAPYQEILSRLDDGDAYDTFLALRPAEQLSILERELEALPVADRKRVMGLLARDLSKPWLPNPGPQTMAVQSEADILLYGGAGGGGKSETLLGLAFTAHKRSLILRRQYTDLSFLTERAIQINKGRTGYNGSAPPTLRTRDDRLIEFGAAQHPSDIERWQGRPHDLIGFDEAAQFLEPQVRFLMPWLRSEDPSQRCRMVLATNPPLSDEGQWLVAMFRPWLDPSHPKPAKPGELRWYVSNEAGEDEEVDGPGKVVVGGNDVMPISRTFIPARAQDNPYYGADFLAKLDSLQEPLRSAIRDGNFMAVRADDAWQVIPSEWVRQAQARWRDTPPPGQSMTCIAADVAQGGSDQTVLASRHGEWFGHLIVRKGAETPDGLSVAGLVFMAMRDSCQVVVDAGGGYGGSAIEHLKRQSIHVEGYRGSDASSAKARGSGLEFANKRAETWWRFREALDPAYGPTLALPPDQDLLADLCTPRLSARAMQVRGVIQVESKDEIRDRLGRSPDRGDAVVMCWAYGGLLALERANNPARPTQAILGYADYKPRQTHAVTKRPRTTWR